MASGSKQKVWLLPAAQGVDVTSDPAHLAPGRAQQVVNLLPDRQGFLRNQVLLGPSVPPFPSPVTGLGNWYAQNNAALNQCLIVSGGDLNAWAVDTTHTPPYIPKPPGPPTTKQYWTPGVRVRMFQSDLEEIMLADDGSANMRYTGNSNLAYALGMGTPVATEWSFRAVTPSVNTGKTYSGSGTNYCRYIVLAESNGIELFWIWSNSMIASWTEASDTVTCPYIIVEAVVGADWSPILNPITGFSVWVTPSSTTFPSTSVFYRFATFNDNSSLAPTMTDISGTTVYNWFLTGFTDAMTDAQIEAIPNPASSVPWAAAFSCAGSFSVAGGAAIGKTVLAAPTYFQYVFTLVDEFGRESNVAYAPTEQAPNLIPTVGYVNTTGLEINGVVTLTANSALYNVQSINVYVSTSSTTDSTLWSEFGGPWYLVANIPVSSESGPWTISFQDSLPDTTVTAATAAPHLGQNDMPNPASMGLTFYDQVILDDLMNIGGLQVSNTGSNTQFATLPVVATDGARLTVGLESGNPIMALVNYADTLLLLRRQDIYCMTGSDVSNFNIMGPLAFTGCIAKDSAVNCNGQVFYLADDGVYLLTYSGGFMPTKVSKEIEASLLVQTRASLESSIGWFYENAYYLAVGATTYRLDLSWNTWTTIASGTAVTATALFSVEGDTNWQFLANGSGTEYIISSLCTYYPNATVVSCVYQTPQMGDRAYQKRLKRIRIFGSGTLDSATGSVIVTQDGGVTFEPAGGIVQILANVPGVSGYLPGCLLDWSPPVDCKGFLFDVTFNLSGTNLYLTDVAMYYEEDQEVEGG